MMSMGLIGLIFMLGVSMRSWLWVLLFILGFGVWFYPDSQAPPVPPMQQTPPTKEEGAGEFKMQVGQKEKKAAGLQT